MRRISTRRASGPRISAGRWKGRRLEAPAGARPTSGMAREALFDLLGPPRIQGSRVLDLYAGSGAIGIEAVSRGAAAAVLVEKNAASLGRNLKRLGDPREIEILEQDAAGALATLVSRGDRFDVVFSDPPYGAAPPEGTGRDAPSLVTILLPSGTFILQHDAGEAPADLPGLSLVSERAYGRNVFAFFARAEATPEGAAPARAEAADASDRAE